MQIYTYEGDSYYDKHIVVADNGKTYIVIDDDGSIEVMLLNDIEELHNSNYLASKSIFKCYGNWKSKLEEHIKDNDEV